MQEPERLLPRKRLLFGVGIAFGVYVALLLLVNTEDLLAQLRRFPPNLLLPLALLKLVSWFFRFQVWQHFLGVAGVRDAIGTTNSALLYLAGFTMAVSPGKSAEVLKALVLRRWTGLPLTQGMPVILAERVVETLSVLILSAVSLLLGAAALEPGPAQSLLMLAAGILAGGLLFMQSRTAQRKLLHLLARLPLLWRRAGVAGRLSGRLQKSSAATAFAPGHWFQAYWPRRETPVVLLVILRGFDVPFSTELLFQSLLNCFLVAIDRRTERLAQWRRHHRIVCQRHAADYRRTTSTRRHGIQRGSDCAHREPSFTSGYVSSSGCWSLWYTDSACLALENMISQAATQTAAAATKEKMYELGELKRTLIQPGRRTR